MRKPIVLISIKPNKVNSSHLSSDDSHSLMRWTNMIYGDALESPLQMVDDFEFIGVGSSFAKALDMVLAMEEYVLEEEFEFKASYVINEDVLDELEQEGNLNKEAPGIHRAYAMMGRIQKDKRRFLVSTKSDTAINNMLKVTQYLIDGWKKKDRGTVSGFLQGHGYKEMARRESKDESSLWRRRRSLAIDEYLACKEVLHQLIKE